MPYHHGNLHEALVDAAVELAATGGPDAVVLREVARHVGVSHNAAYRHFADRDQVMRAATARVLTRFGGFMAARVAAADTDGAAGGTTGGVDGAAVEAAYARFEATGRAYVDFALGNPGLFRLMCAFTLGEIVPDTDVPHPYAQLTERLDELLAVGALTPERRADGETAACAAVHGYTMWVLDGPARTLTTEQRAAGLEQVIHMVRFGI